MTKEKLEKDYLLRSKFEKGLRVKPSIKK